VSRIAMDASSTHNNPVHNQREVAKVGSETTYFPFK